MNRKKVMIGLTYYLPNTSGLTAYAAILAEELAGRGSEVTVLTSKVDVNQPEIEVINKVRIVRVGGFRLGKGFIMPGYFWKSGHEVKKAEVVTCHLPSIESWWLAIWAMFYRKTLVATYHCQIRTGNWLGDKIIDICQNLVLDRAKTIVVNSLDYIENNGLLIKYRAKVVEILPPVKAVTPTMARPQEKGRVIGFLGRISREKNIELLLQAMKSSEITGRLLIAGPGEICGEETYQKKITELINEAGDKVRRIGRVDNTADFFRRCDCLVLTSVDKLESFGIVQVEAMLNGVPCIASNLPGIRVPITISKMGELFEPGDANDLAVKIALVLKRGKLYYQKRARNLDKFKYSKTIDEYEKIYRRAL